MTKYYWFRKLLDNSTFCIEGDQQAGRIFLFKEWSRAFQYLGWSDGSKLKSIMSGKGKISTEKMKKIANEELSEDAQLLSLQDLYRQAEKEELEMAVANPDKSRPHNSAVIDLDGRPVSTGPIADMARMMGQKI